MVIKIILMCYCIFLPSFRGVWFIYDDFAQSYMLSKRVTNMDPGHVKGVNKVALSWLMRFMFREVHFLSKYSPKKAMDCLYQCTFIVCTHPYTTPVAMLDIVSSLVFIQRVTNQCQRFLCNVWFQPSICVI